MSVDSMRKTIYDHDVVNTSGYVVRDMLEYDWSEGKSWSQNNSEKNKETSKCKPMAYIKYPQNN